MSVQGKLKDLVELLTDSQRGYADAADHVKDPKLKEQFMKFGNRRGSMIMDLGNELGKLGEETPMDGTTKGELHRRWMDLREKLTGRDELRMLEECERGDNYLLQQYDAVISDDEIPHHLKAMLQEHQVRVRADIGELKVMKQLNEHEADK